MAQSNFLLSESMGAVSKSNTQPMQISLIPLDQLVENEGNFFAVDDVQELADNIALHGLDNPLTVCRAERLADGRQMYRIVAGHRRRKAVDLLGWQTVPCNIKTYEDADSEEIALIQSNMTARELTYYERMVAVVKLSEAYARMKEHGADLSGRLRDHVVEKSKQSASAVQRMTYIYYNLSAPVMEYLKAGVLTEAVADEIAHCPEEMQASFAAQLAEGKLIKAADIKAARAEQSAPEAPPITQALKELDRAIRKAVEKADEPAEKTAPKKGLTLTKEDILQLTNNDKRKAILDRWREWPIWADVPEIGLTVHRLDLPGGKALTACWYAGDDYYPGGGERNVNRPRIHLIGRGGKLSAGGQAESVLVECLQSLRKEMLDA